MQGLAIVVLGIALMYLVLSGKLDCLIAAFRACSGTSEAATPTVQNSSLPNLNSKLPDSAQAILDGVLSPATA